MLKLLGAGMIIIGTVLFCREYCRVLDRRISSLCAFLSYLKTKARLIRTVAEKGSRVAEGYLCDPELCDFAEAVVAGRPSAEAFDSCRAAGRLPEQGVKILKEYFSLCGSDYAEGEVRLIDGAVSALEELCAAEEGEREKRGRTCYAVALALAAGAVIALL